MKHSYKSAFRFCSHEETIDAIPDAFVATIPRGITDKAILFDAYASSVMVPEYCGNWDALLDCLRDLSWIEEPRVVVLHDDVPALPAGDLRKYLYVLMTSVEDQQGNGHTITPVFPSNAEATVCETLSDLMKNGLD
jgi:hypothetical protein